MSETAAVALFPKYAAALAGFFGSVVTLSFVKDLPRLAMFSSVGTGAVTAHYVTPLVWVAFPVFQGQFGVAFVLGILSMNLIPGLMKVGEEFAKSPLNLIRRILKR